MSLYKDNDINILKNNIERILDEVEDKKMVLIEPFASEIRAINNIILDFIREKKRKLYGGFALNLLIKNEKPSDAIYKDKENPDIDFYSPEPIKDLIDLCNIIHQKEYKYVRGYEAQHKETYSIRVNNHLYCDISYVPKNIYVKIPYKEINSLMVISPVWYTIDFLRMMTDPLTSYWRIEKHFERFYKIQKYYPFPHIEKPINVEYPKEEKNNMKILFDIIYKFQENRDTTITVGFYAYNIFLRESTVLKSTNYKAKKFKNLDIPYYEIISTEFRDDCLELLSRLKNSNIGNDIKVVEHYPYFQFLGHSAHIYYKDYLIAIVYHYNKKCLPYIQIPIEKSSENNKPKAITDKGYINMGTYSLTLLYCYASAMKARTQNDNDTKDLYYTMISHLLEMREYYFNKFKKNLLSDTMFKDFVLECKGYAMTPEKERGLLIEKRKKKNQRILFAYDPSDGIKDSDINYIFANSSGNPVKNNKNLKLEGDKPENIEDIADIEEVSGENIEEQ